MDSNFHIINFKEKLKNYKTKTRILNLVKDHFFTNYTDERLIEMICTTGNMAFENETIFEEYRIWSKDRDDKSLFYYLENHFQDALKEEKIRKRANIRSQSNDGTKKLKSTFSANLEKFATSRGLKTNRELGIFLSISEQRARVLMLGKNKPQRKTLMKIAEKFDISIDELIE